MNQDFLQSWVRRHIFLNLYRKWHRLRKQLHHICAYNDLEHKPEALNMAVDLNIDLHYKNLRGMGFHFVLMDICKLVPQLLEYKVLLVHNENPCTLHEFIIVLDVKSYLLVLIKFL